jgi:ParB/RepB/Spo0J family partition protein
MAKQEGQLLKPSSVAIVPPSEILPNPENPRMFFPEESLKILRESIRSVGILVPLTVFKSKTDAKLHLLDGERRWRCAKDLGLSKVPVNIVPEPTTFQNIVVMFNIHALRESWELMPTALKLEVLIRVVKQETSKKHVGVAHLSQITGLTRPTIQRCLTLLELPKQYQDLVLARGEERLKTDFFIELTPVIKKIEHEFPDLFKKYTKNGILDRFIDKYRNNVITDVVDLREIKTLINSTKKGVAREIVEQALDRMVGDPKASIKDAYPSLVRTTLELADFQKLAENLIEDIQRFESDDTSKRESFKNTLKHLHEVIMKKIEKLGT